MVVCYKGDVVDPTQMSTSIDSDHIDPLHVGATQQQERNTEVEIAFYTTQSAMEWTGEDAREESLEDKDLHMSENPLRTVYKAKSVSSVRSAFLWESPWARAGWAGWAPGGDADAGSAALALSSRNLSNSAETMRQGLIIIGWINGTIYRPCSRWTTHTFTGHSFLCGITFLMERIILKKIVITIITPTEM